MIFILGELMISFYNQQEQIYSQPLLLTKCDAFLSKKGYLEERNVALFCFYLNLLDCETWWERGG